MRGMSDPHVMGRGVVAFVLAELNMKSSKGADIRFLSRNQYEQRPHGRLRLDTAKRTKDEEGPSTSGTTSRSIFHKNPRLPRG